jgi:UDP-N-acetylmuramyl pentapeptide phosphotransferase/UDP-N-acetylglucosamine-1-phosphate transferase
MADARRPTARRAAASAATALISAGAARVAYRSLNLNPPGGATQWTRTNHRGEPVTLLEGPAVAAAGVLAALSAPGLPGRSRAALAVAAAGAGALGGYDDIAGSGDKRGFRGHLGALAHGEITTGAVKLGGIGATGVAAAALTGGPAVDVAVNAALVAGAANLLNLFDLRPGRAIKVALAAGLPIGLTQLSRPGAARPRAVAVPIGAAAALLPEDLGERAMLGDAGANALGAMLGTAAAGSLSRRSRVALLAGITALTAASEVVSFTKVIQRTPPLHWLDMLGRRPAHAAGPAARPIAAPPAGEPVLAGLNGHADRDPSSLAAPPSP